MKNLLRIVAGLPICFIIFLSSSYSFAQTDTIRPVHVGIIYPISSNGLKAAEYTNRFSLHAIAGLSKNETLLTISGAANVIRQNANGTQITGVINVIGNSAKGAQIAGFANIVRNEAVGAQVAGVLNYSGSAKGFQVAGFGNVTRRDANGLQISGVINQAKNVNTQVAGLINIAKNVKGVQLAGFMNIADSSDYPIGLFNFIKNGEKSIGISVDETMTSITSFRSGGRVLYGIVGAGYNFKDSDQSFYAIEAGLGAHIPVAGNFRINAEIVNQYLSDFKKGDYTKASLRILPSYKLGKKLEIFGGPSFNYVQFTQDKGYDFIDKFIWKNNRSHDFQGVYVGFNAGVQVIL